MPRKKAFSNKQKKQQLRAKRERLRGKAQESQREFPSDDNSTNSEEDNKESVPVKKVHEQPTAWVQGGKNFDPNRYRLHFLKVSREEIEARKEQSREIIEPVLEAELEVSLESVNKLGSVLDMPKRPPWTYTMTKERVDQNEAKYFQEYVRKIYEQFKPSDLSYFELNLETWRQLWRVIEVSDVLLLITDVRHPVIHFPPALYEYVVKELKKHLILILNKVDLVPPDLAVAWKHYFLSKFKNIHIVCFTSFPKDEEERIRRQRKVLSRGPRRSQRHSFSVGAHALLSAVQSIVGQQFDLSSWERKIGAQECGEQERDSEDGTSSEEPQGGPDTWDKVERQEGVVTLGFVGHPNVGKSSLLNGLTGEKVVSTSRTPGHTKHFQTIFLTPNVRLCDSPGLVFPSLVDKQLQVLSGMYPISQVQEPYTAVGYLAARASLAHRLNLGQDNPGHAWSAWEVCEAWADMRGYSTAKTGRPDVYRAANSILRLAVEGRILLCFYPPGYLSAKEEWRSHPDSLELERSQKTGIACEDLQPCESHGAGASGASSDDQETSEDEDDTKAALVSSNPFALLGDE